MTQSLLSSIVYLKRIFQRILSLQDNVNEIFKHYGLDTTKIDKSRDLSTLPQITVGDLEKALKEAKKTPKTVFDRDSAVTEKTNNEISVAATCYLGVRYVGGIPINSIDVSGYTRYNSSYIP
ncbi:MAG: hypothetical protein Kow00111_28280 [Thermincola ferriacetica]